MAEEKKKRVYNEARAAANKKYDSKTYKSYNFRLRVDDDADIIASIEKAKAEGVSYRDWLRRYY